jgi:death-on-curing protein
MEPSFLTLDDVLAIHENRIRKYGGSSGTRDVALLDSALGNVKATFGGQFLHETLPEMAASYLYSICRNHPFIDGNKRTALACALAFFGLNGIRITSAQDDLYDLVMAVAEGRASKAVVAVFFETRVNPAR